MLNNIKFAQTNVSLTIPDKVAYLYVQLREACSLEMQHANLH